MSSNNPALRLPERTGYCISYTLSQNPKYVERVEDVGPLVRDIPSQRLVDSGSLTRRSPHHIAVKGIRLSYVQRIALHT